MIVKQVSMMPTFAYCLSTIGLIPWIAALMWWPGGAWPGGVEPQQATASPVPRPHLPPAFGGYRALDNTLLIELPDSGGYTVNGMPVDSTRLGSLFHQVFDSWEPSRRGAFLLDNPKRPWQDVEIVVEKAWEAGVLVFDAVRSNHAPLRGFTTMDSLESHTAWEQVRGIMTRLPKPRSRLPTRSWQHEEDTLGQSGIASPQVGARVHDRQAWGRRGLSGAQKLCDANIA